MLDIDLEFLNFLLNPTYEYLKKDIKIIEKEYLKNSKIDNFNEINYLFLTNVNELAYFVNDLNKKITEDIYIKFGNFFGLNLKNNIDDNYDNFIIDILKSKGLTTLSGDTLINILRTDIRDYLVNITKNSTNQKDKELATNAILYLDELIIKYDNITNLTNPKINEVLEIFNKRHDIKRKIQHQIINEYSFLLTEEGKKIINSDDFYDIEKLLEKEDKFNYYLNIKITETDPLKHYVFDYGNILENCTSNIDATLKERMTKTDFKDYNKLSKDLIRYNDLYQKEINNYILTISKDELKEKIYYLLKDKLELLTKDIKIISKEEMFQILFEAILDIINNKCYNLYNIKLKTIILSPINCVNICNNKNIVCEFYDVLNHELGHAYDFYEISSINDKESLLDYELLYEIYNDYNSKKLINKLIQQNKLKKQGIIYKNFEGNYSSHFFGLIDFIEEYDDIFRSWIDNNDINILKTLLGNKNFNNLINNINNFDYKRFLIDEKYANKLIKSYDNILRKTKRRVKFKNIIN